MKKAVSVFLIIAFCCTICLSSSAGNLQIGSDSVCKAEANEIINKYQASLSCGDFNEYSERIENLLLEYQLTQMDDWKKQQLSTREPSSNHIRSLSEIESDLLSYGVAKICYEDAKILLGTAADETMSIPYVPGNTKYVDFFMTSGSAYGSYYYIVYAQSSYVPSTALAADEHHPLYDCTVTDCISSRNDHTEFFLSQTLELGFSALSQAGTEIPGIFNTMFQSILTEALTTRQSIGATISNVCKQTLAYKFVSNDQSAYYSHMQTAQRMAITPVYNLACSINGAGYFDSCTLNVIVIDAPYYSDILDSIVYYQNGNLVLRTYTVGNISLTYKPYASSSYRTATLPYTFYSELSTIPGV